MERDVALIIGIALFGCAVNVLVKVAGAHSTSSAFQHFAALT
jgi:hypothetical protein